MPIHCALPLQNERLESLNKSSSHSSDPKIKRSFPKEERKNKSDHFSEIEEEIKKLIQNCIGKEKEIDPLVEGLNFSLPTFNISALNLPIACDKIKASEALEEIVLKMVKTMCLLQQSGVQETTFILDAAEYRSSLFYGCKISITEYSTAPKVFNISFSSSSENIAQFFQAHAPDLLAFFQKNRFPFEVNRIESNLEDLTQKNTFDREKEEKDQ